MSDLKGFVGELMGYYRDIEVAKASPNGVAKIGNRVESIPDQTSVGAVAPTGPALQNGIQINKTVLGATVLIVGAIAVVRALR